jgi:flavin-dependent dehydrogenase
MTNQAAGERLSTDVLVLGGGPAGTWAAVKAALHDTSTLLTDRKVCENRDL